MANGLPEFDPEFPLLTGQAQSTVPTTGGMVNMPNFAAIISGFDPGPIVGQPLQQTPAQAPVTPPGAGYGPGESIGFFEGLELFGSQLPTMFTATVPETFQRSARAFFGEVGLEDQTWLDEMIAKNVEERERARVLTPEEREKTWFKVPFTDIKITAGDIENAPDSLGYSIANMGAVAAGKIAGRIAGGLTGPLAPIARPVLEHGLAFLAGSAVSGGATYDQFMEMVRGEVLRNIGDREITPADEEMWAALRDDIASDARWYGFWEAAPETVGNQLMLGIGRLGLKKPLKKVAGKLFVNKLKSNIAKKVGQHIATKLGVPAAKLGLMLTEESLTEMVTQKKQADIEHELGLREDRITYTDALKEVLPTVLLTTPLLGSASTVIQRAAQGKKLADHEKEALKVVNRRRVEEGLEPITEDETGALIIPPDLEVQQPEYVIPPEDMEEVFEPGKRQEITITPEMEQIAQSAWNQMSAEQMQEAEDWLAAEEATARETPERWLAFEREQARVRQMRDDLIAEGVLSPETVESMQVPDLDTIMSRPAETEQQVKDKNQKIDRLGEAMEETKSNIPALLRPAVEQMKRHIQEGDAKNYRMEVDPDTGQREMIPTGSSYENWVKKRHLNPPFKVTQKDKQGNYYYKIGEKDFNAIIKKLEAGKKLTDRQQWIYDNAILPAARNIRDTDTEFARNDDANYYDQAGYELLGQKMPAVELRQGDNVVLDEGPTGMGGTGLEEFTVVAQDDGKGNVVLWKDGARYTYDPFDMVNVFARKPNDLWAAYEDVAGPVTPAAPVPTETEEGVERRAQPVREGGVWSQAFRDMVNFAKRAGPAEFAAEGQALVKRGDSTIFEIAERFGKRVEPKANLNELFKIVHARINRGMEPMKRFEEMENDLEVEAALNGDFLTGLRGPRGWNLEDKRRGNVVAMDLDALKWFNDNLGYAAGDDIILTMADAMRESGLEERHLYRVGGDEFYMQHDDSTALDDAIERIQIYLDNNPVTLYIENRPIDYVIQFSYGKGTNVTEAQDAEAIHKAARENEGSRPRRGEVPGTIIQQFAERHGVSYPGSELSQAEITRAKNKYQGRKIDAAAIRLPSGEVLTGPNHAEIFNSLSDTQQQYSPLVDGFTTETGTFLVRELAAQVVNEPSQQSEDIVGKTVVPKEGARVGDDLVDLIPQTATVQIQALHERTGKVVTVEENARQALADLDNQIESYYELLGCVA